MSRTISVVLILILALSLVGCGQGLPTDGQYELKPHSLTYDGRDYEFYWVDGTHQLRQYKGRDVRLVEDERSFLEVKDGKPTVHLSQDDPVTVLAQDQGGQFSSFWFPFLLGQAMGGLGNRTVVISQPYPGTSQRAPTEPAYRYPPTDTIGRGETLHGDVTMDKPQAPDYGKVKPAPNAVSGQNQGTGSGTAATNKQTGTISGQQGGTGSGSAATNKGGFRASGSSGNQSVSGKSSGTGTGNAATGKVGGSISNGGKGGLSGGKSSGSRIGGGRSGGRR